MYDLSGLSSNLYFSYFLCWCCRCLSLLPSINFIKPNAAELAALADGLWGLRETGGSARGPFRISSIIFDHKEGGTSSSAGGMLNGQRPDQDLPTSLTALLPAAAAVLAGGAKHIALTLGSEGAALLSRHHLDPPQHSDETGRGGSEGDIEVHVSFMRAVPTEVVNLSGAGEWVSSST